MKKKIEKRTIIQTKVIKNMKKNRKEDINTLQNKDKNKMK